MDKIGKYLTDNFSYYILNRLLVFVKLSHFRKELSNNQILILLPEFSVKSHLKHGIFFIILY